MKRSSVAGVAISLLVATAFIAPAAAESLFGIVGSSDSDSLVTIGSGSAGSSGLVNLGIGGGDGNVLDANIGRSSSSGRSVVDANISAGRGSGLGVDVGLLNDTVTANVGVGGGRGVSVDVGIGGGRGGGGNGGGGNGGGGNGGGGNGGGGHAGGGNGGGGGHVALGGGGGGGGGGFAMDPSCNGANPNAVWQLYDRTSLSGWNRASGIQIVPIKVCPTAKRQLSGLLASQQKHVQMQNAVMSDALVAAALSRSPYKASNVIAVERAGAQLTVYVY